MSASASSSSSSDAPPSALTYDLVSSASVQSLDTSSARNPLPASPPQRLSDFLSDDGAVIWLVRRPGCALCRGEAAQILPLYRKYFGDADATASASASSGSGQSKPATPPLLCLVKENLDDELRKFLPSIAPTGRLLLHSDKSLYSSLGQAKLRWWQLFSPSTVKKYLSDKSAHDGNVKGEGWIKGALMVVGSREQGVLAVHLEEFGKEADLSHIEEAMKKIKGARVQQ